MIRPTPIPGTTVAKPDLRLGDKRGAIADFKKAVELRPDLRTAGESLQQLGVTP